MSADLSPGRPTEQEWAEKARRAVHKADDRIARAFALLDVMHEVGGRPGMPEVEVQAAFMRWADRYCEESVEVALREVARERDASSAIERAQVGVIERLTAKATTTSEALSQLKAQWQAEALREAASAFGHVWQADTISASQVYRALKDRADRIEAGDSRD